MTGVQVFVDGPAYVALLNDEFARLATPAGPERRIGAAARAGDELTIIRRSLAARRIAGGTGRDWDAYLALQTSSTLYAAGAPHELWRHWAGLSAFGYLLDGQYGKACPLLVLAGEWDCLASLRGAAPGRCAPPTEAIWRLAVGEIDEPRWPDSGEAGWRDLLAALRAGDQSEMDAALNEIVAFWILEGEGDWELFHPGYAPDYGPEPCAAAALAKRAGHEPAGLRADVARYLDAGLAEGYPDPLYPALAPLAPARHSARAADLASTT